MAFRITIGRKLDVVCDSTGVSFEGGKVTTSDEARTFIGVLERWCEKHEAELAKRNDEAKQAGLADLVRDMVAHFGIKPEGQSYDA